MNFKDKKLYIRRADYNRSQLSASSNNRAEFSNVDVLIPSEVVRMGTFEKDFIAANGLSLFPSKGQSLQHKTGYVSNSVSKINGTFTNNPILTITSLEAISPSNMYMVFDGIHVVDMEIKTYFNNEMIESFNFEDLSDKEFTFLQYFKSFNKMTIEIKKIEEPYNRVHISYVSFDKKPYEFNDSLYSSYEPDVELEDQIRNIIVNYYVTEGDKEIINSVIAKCNDKGSDLEYSNPFITTKEVAQNVGEWLSDYYRSKMIYHIDHIGDPIIQTDDLVHIQNKNNNNIYATVETCETSFANGGIRGRIIAKRRDDNVENTKN